MKKYLAIVNPSSGVTDKSDVLPLLAKAFTNEEERIYFMLTNGDGDAEHFTKEAIVDGYETIIAIGGDGTINAIAGALYNSSVNLGIIPKGSGNGMARALGIPVNDDRAAIDIIRRGNLRAIDTSFANGIPFFCTFGIGFDAEVTRRYAEASTRGIFTYLRSAVDEYIHFKPKRYTISACGKTFLRKAMLITCANIDQYGSNTYIAPGARPDDGLLDLVVISPIPFLKTAQLALQLFTQTIGDNARVESIRCPKITLRRDAPGYVQLDGESLIMGEEIKIKVIPRSLSVYAPENKDEQEQEIVENNKNTTLQRAPENPYS